MLTRRSGRPPNWQDSAGGVVVAEVDGSPEVDPVTRLEIGAGLGVTDDGGAQATVSLDGYWEPLISDEEIVTVDGDIIMVWVEL